MTATDLDTGVLESLDFTPAIPCEYSLHATRHADEPAMFLIRGSCRVCPESTDYYLCLSGWEILGRCRYVYCPECEHAHASRDECLTILAVIGGPR